MTGYRRRREDEGESPPAQPAKLSRVEGNDTFCGNPSFSDHSSSSAAYTDESFLSDSEKGDHKPQDASKEGKTNNEVGREIMGDDLDNPLGRPPVGPLDDPAPDMNLDNDDEMEEGEIRENDEQDEDEDEDEDDGHDQLMPSAPGLTSFFELKLESEKMLRTDGGGIESRRVPDIPMRIHGSSIAEHAERIRRATIGTDLADPFDVSRIFGY
ncbi:hypothetical protein ABKA04_001296 [Annulohypoxylon sp. FPYF3050]